MNQQGVNRQRGQVLALLLPLIAAAFFLVLWQAVVVLTRLPQAILPTPLVVFGQFFGSLPELVREASVTVRDVLVAFAIATVVGAALASCVTFSAALRDAVWPNLVLLQLIPKIALAPLFVVWMGVDAPSRVAFAVFIGFFPIALSTATGLANADAHALMLCRALGASAWQVFMRVRVPFALSHFFAGLKIATTLVFIGVVVGEFISSNAGLGHYVLLAGATGATPRIFAGLLALALCGLALYGAVLAVERLVQRWWWE
jgi:NitT/TauT family transport system permease protein